MAASPYNSRLERYYAMIHHGEYSGQSTINFQSIIDMDYTMNHAFFRRYTLLQTRHRNMEWHLF